MRASRLVLCRWVIGLFATAFCVPFALGQSQSEPGRLSVSVLTNLARGVSLDELTERTGILPMHQFTIRLGSNELSCVSISFEDPRGSLNFLFTNGKLAAIQDQPRVDFETKTYRGKPWRVPKAVNAEQRMSTVVQAPDLSASEIVERLEQWSRNETAVSKGSEPQNILPAFIITAPLFSAKMPSKLRAETEAAKLAEKFDPFKIKLGMTAAEVKAMFGKPVHQRDESSSCQLHVYGSHLARNVSVHVPSVWVSIVFCDNEVTRVFSHDFFDKRLTPQRSGF